MEYNLRTFMQMVNSITILPSKFYQLKYLDICVPGQYYFVPDYDSFSLASFLDASHLGFQCKYNFPYCN